jgi:hypothetical protein
MTPHVQPTVAFENDSSAARVSLSGRAISLGFTGYAPPLFVDQKLFSLCLGEQKGRNDDKGVCYDDEYAEYRAQ